MILIDYLGITLVFRATLAQCGISFVIRAQI